MVAVVNQEIITFSEVEKMSRPLQVEIQTEDRLERRERVHEIFRKVLDRLIEEKLIDQEVKKSGIKVTSKELEGAIEDVKRRFAVDQENFEKLLAAEGMTLEAYKKEIEKQILRTKMIKLAVKVEPTAGEKELRDFYQKHIDRYRVNESYRISHILFPVPKDASLEQSREIRKRCQKVLERIKGGEDFGEMVLLYSEDPSSRKDRGDMGYFKRGDLLPALDREALRLQVPPDLGDGDGLSPQPDCLAEVVVVAVGDGDEVGFRGEVPPGHEGIDEDRPRSPEEETGVAEPGESHTGRIAWMDKKLWGGRALR